MKRIILFSVFALTGLFSYAQVNVINSTNGSLTIIPKGIRGKLPTNNTNDVTNIVLGDGALSNNINGTENIAVGAVALYDNATGSSNVAVGKDALSTNVKNSGITAIGYGAMKYATPEGTSYLGIGLGFSGNTAIGYNALRGSILSVANMGTGNTAVGAVALSKNTTGTENVAVGTIALNNNTSGAKNIAVGAVALSKNTTGTENVAMGTVALWNSTTGSSNVAIGTNAGDIITTGSRNTFLGTSSDASANNLANSIAIGYNAIVNASNKAVIGNSSVTTVGGYGNWSNYSDRRLKENIRYTDRLGLDFILKLKTASYNYTSDSNKRRRDGMIAQDVQAVMRELDVPFSGLVEDNDAQKTLNLAYADFVMPLINAVKEQQKQIELLKDENSAYKNEVQMLKSNIVEIKAFLKTGLEMNKSGDK